MSESIFKKVENTNAIRKIELIERLLDQIEQITEFSESELKAISILSSDMFLNEYLQLYMKTKKHVKRKHAKELLEALRAIAELDKPNEYFVRGGK